MIRVKRQYQITLFLEKDVEAIIKLAKEEEKEWLAHCIRLIYTHGLRISELEGVVRSAVPGTVFILRAKSGYDCWHELTESSSASMEYLKKYIQIRGNSIHIRRIQRDFKSLLTNAIDVGILDESFIKGRLHDLRHSCAAHLVKNNIDIHVIQRYLGHRSIGSTEYYTRSFSDEFRKPSTLFGVNHV